MWDANQNCIMCVDDFIIVGNTCEAVTTQVANCDVYSSKTVCQACSSNYTLVANACVQLPSVSNC